MGSTNQADPSWSTPEFHEYWWTDLDFILFCPLHLLRGLNIWSSQFLRLLRPYNKWRGQKNKNHLFPSIFMKFWSWSNLDQLDWLTPYMYLLLRSSLVSLDNFEVFRSMLNRQLHSLFKILLLWGVIHHEKISLIFFAALIYRIKRGILEYFFYSNKQCY